jgi:gas vesicle protein
MLRGIRTAIKFFTIGLLAGVLLAPRKGDETRRLLVDRGKEYVQEVMNANAAGSYQGA